MSGVQNGTLAAKGDWKEDEVLLPDWDGVDLDEAIKMVRPTQRAHMLATLFLSVRPSNERRLGYWRVLAQGYKDDVYMHDDEWRYC